MKKNAYQAPVMEVIDLKGKVAPLCASGEEAGGGGTGFGSREDLDEE